MSTEIIPSRSNGQTIDQTWFNILMTVISTVFVPRVNGTPTDVGGNLGSATYRWDAAWLRSVVFSRGTETKQVTLQSPTSLAANMFLTLPGTLPGSGNQTLCTDNAGNITPSWPTDPNFVGKAAAISSSKIVVSEDTTTNGMQLLRAVIGAAGTYSGEGITAVRVTNGVYNILWTNAFGSAPTVVATINQQDVRIIEIASTATTSCQVRTYDTSGTLTDTAFQALIMGPRA